MMIRSRTSDISFSFLRTVSSALLNVSGRMGVPARNPGLTTAGYSGSGRRKGTAGSGPVRAQMPLRSVERARQRRALRHGELFGLLLARLLELDLELVEALLCARELALGIRQVPADEIEVLAEA